MGSAALVFGIMSLIFAAGGGFASLECIIFSSHMGVLTSVLMPFIAFSSTVIGSIIAIFAIILGAIAKKDPNQKGAKAGLVMGIIALSCGIIEYVACVCAAV